MDPITAKLMSAAGAAADPVYVDDVFSTFLYEGNGSAQAIRNGINLGTAFGGNSYDFRGQTVMSKSGALSGATASKTFTVSFWFYAKTLGGSIYQEPAGPSISFAGSDLAISGYNSSYSTIFGVSTAVAADRWYHVLASWDLANSSNRYLYINDAAVSPAYPDYTNDTIAINVSGTRYVGSTNGSSGKFDGNIAHLYYDTTYRDLSTTSNRRLFVTAGLEPATGQASLNPLLYLPLDAATGAATNSGTGGNFTATTGPFFDEGFGPGTGASGEGGLVWIKNRSTGYDHILVDTERGANKDLKSNVDSGEETTSASDAAGARVTSFTSTGFTTGKNTRVNRSGDDLCSWTFRKCPGFFDIITYTGNGNASGRTLSHSLGSAPGSIWVKRTTSTSAGEDWICYHRSVGTAGHVRINKTISYLTNQMFANVTATSFDLIDADAGTNANNETYVAYIFAHDDQSFGDAGNESIIKCGSYTGNGTSGSSVNTITLGFEPQWVIIKKTSGTGNWLMLDTMRGFTTVGVLDEYMHANSNSAASVHQYGGLTSTGFQVEGTDGDANGNGASYVYIAIRRPHKPPETAAGAFDLRLSSTDVGGFQTSTSVLADLVINFNNPASGSVEKYWVSRLTKTYQVPTSAAEVSATAFSTDHSTGFVRTNWWGGTAAIDYTFRRAPGFFDIVTYAGNSTSGRTESHNLGVVPEMMLIKARDGARSWRVYDSSIGANGSLRLDSDAAKDSNSAYWSTPTADNIILGTDNDTNSSSYDYIAYLFATVSGISKIGTFSGTGNDINVDCGFTAGARFVMIKRTDSSGDWLYWDTLRGIVSGNESAFPMNGQSTNGNFGVDWIDPLNAGFTVTALYNQSEVWSDYPKTGTQPAGAEWTKAFNGNLTNGVYPNTNVTTTLTIDTSDRPTWSSSIRIYVVNYGGVVTINGTNVSSATSSTLGWRDLSSILGSSGTLASFSLTNPGGNYAKINAVELDGKLLVDTGVSVTPSPVNTSGGTYLFIAIA